MSLFPKKVEYPFKPTTDTEPELLPIKEPEPAAMSTPQPESRSLKKETEES